MAVQADDFESSPTLLASGRIHVILAMNMKRWIDLDSISKFLRIRDSEEYAQCLEHLPHHIDNGKFRLSQNTEELEQIGYDLGVFRAYALENLFMPTYEWVGTSTHVGAHKSNARDGAAFQAYWEDWHSKTIRLSRAGIITVKLERQVQDLPLTSIAEMVLGLEHLEPHIVGELQQAIAQGDSAQIERLGVRLQRGAHKVWGIQWQIAKELAHQFLQSIKSDPTYSETAKQQVLAGHSRLVGKLAVRPHALVWHSDQKPQKDFFLNTTEPKDEETHPLRDRYVIFSFSKLMEETAPTVALSPQQIQANLSHSRSISSLLEGVILGQLGKHPEFSKFKDDLACEFIKKQDLATWQNEMCLLTLDNGLIYHYSDHEFPISQEISFPDRQVKHEQYWGSIIRGIEHLMDVRLEAQMMAGETAERLVEAAEFTRQVRHPKASDNPDMDADAEKSHEIIQNFAVNVSYLARMVAHLRNASSPITLSKADYAVNKFQNWLETSQVSKTLQDADSNLRDINAFLFHYDDTRLGQESLRLSKSIERLQNESQSTNDMTLLMTAMFSGIMTVLSYLSLPSFTADLGRMGDIQNVFSFLAPTEVRVVLGWFGVFIFVLSFVVTAILLVFAIVRIRAGVETRKRSLLRRR